MRHNLGVGVGDRIVLHTPRGLLTSRVGGVVHDFLSPRGTVLMARELYQRHWHDDAITHALVRLAPGADVAAVRAEIARRLGARYSLRVLTVGELVEWFAGQARRAFSAIYALGVMVLVVVGLGVADTIAAGVLERRRELATMAALGLRRTSITRLVLAEAALLGVGGVVVALPVGLLLGLLWVRVTFPDLVGWVLELHVPGLYLAVTAALAVAVCVVAATLPAYASRRMPVSEALRFE
jgi:putative ABC transport system permease protein